jgi:hypothetical protein
MTDCSATMKAGYQLGPVLRVLVVALLIAFLVLGKGEPKSSTTAILL